MSSMKLLTKKEIVGILRISTRKFYRVVLKDPSFPNARLIGASKLWFEEEVFEWVETKSVPANASIHTVQKISGCGRPTKTEQVLKRLKY